LEETERQRQDAIALYLESLAAHGEAIPEEGPSFQGRVTVPPPFPFDSWPSFRLTARKVVRALKRAGFVENRQSGSHLVLIHPETKARTVGAIHPGRTIKEPLLRAIDAHLSVGEFIELL